MTAVAFATPLRCIEAPAGAVLHGMKRSAPGFAGFAEAYFSEIHEGTTKDWRRHRRVTVNLVVPAGSVRFVVRDAAEEKYKEFRLGRSPDDYARLTIPPGLWFAFRGLGPGTSLVLSIIDQEHDPAEAESAELAAFSFAW